MKAEGPACHDAPHSAAVGRRRRTLRCRTTRLVMPSTTPLTMKVDPASATKVPALAPNAVSKGDGGIGRMGGGVGRREGVETRRPQVWDDILLLAYCFRHTQLKQTASQALGRHPGWRCWRAPRAPTWQPGPQQLWDGPGVSPDSVALLSRAPQAWLPHPNSKLEQVASPRRCPPRNPLRDTAAAGRTHRRTSGRWRACGGQASSESPGFLGRHGNVFLYVPNLIGTAQGARRPPAWPLPPPPPGACRHHTGRHTLPASSPSRPAGYARVLAAVYAFGVALTNPTAAVLAYFASFVCDELDGRFARKFNQSSTFGAGALGARPAAGRGADARAAEGRSKDTDGRA